MTQRSPVRGMWRTWALRSVGIAEFGFTPSGRVTGNTRPLPLLAECSFAVPWRAKSRPFEVAPPNVGSADPNTRETLPPCHRSPQLRNAGSVRALSAAPALRGLCHGVDVLAVPRFRRAEISFAFRVMNRGELHLSIRASLCSAGARRPGAACCYPGGGGSGGPQATTRTRTRTRTRTASRARHDDAG